MRSNYTARNRSIVTDLFAGQMRSEVCCLQCQRRRVAFDPFLDLSLPLPPLQHSNADSGVTLADCFNAFTACEQLSERDGIFCPTCKSHTASTKALSLSRLPPLLVLHIKRFEYNSRGGRRKLNTPIAAPLTIQLQMTAGQQQRTTLHSYSLLATINHMGTAQGGHYIAHAQMASQWYCFNDSHVQPVDAKQTGAQHSQSAYVLFYQSTAAAADSQH